MFKVNFNLKPYPFFEIRYRKRNTWFSFPIISVFAEKWSIGFVLYPFAFSLNLIRRIKPAPLTPEEKAELERLLENERD